MNTALAPTPNLPGLTFPEPRDPSEMAFPALLPMELAMKVDTPEAICQANGITRGQFMQLIKHPVFIRAYQEAVELLKVDGMSFKVKAGMQAEEYLKIAFEMVHNPVTSDSVRADIIKNTVRWAGYDHKAADAGNTGSNFNIQINLA